MPYFIRPLSINRALPWSETLIARYEERWNWELLSGNPALPWSEALIARFEKRWVFSAVAKVHDFGVQQLTESQVVQLLEEIWGQT